MVFVETSERNKAYFVTNDINSILDNIMDYCSDLEISIDINETCVTKLQNIRAILENTHNEIFNI